MRHLPSSLLSALALVVVSGAAPSASPPPGPENFYDITWDLRIPMRDGVRLHASLYRPHGLEKPAPVVFNMTPSREHPSRLEIGVAASTSPASTSLSRRDHR